MASVVTEDVREVLVENLLPRFVDYASIDTLSDSSNKTDGKPSSQRQWTLIHKLENELKELGLPTHVDEKGYVYATLKGNASGAPITLLAHVDTADAVPVLGVKPRVLTYKGGVINYPDSPSLSLDPDEFPVLNNYIGQKIVTASGLTLLGADDKAGIAEIMSCLVAWIKHPEIPHPDVHVCFTHDEEIGHGIDEIDLDRLSTICYTLDGGEPGSLDVETWNAYKMKVTFGGVASHAGTAKGVMVNSIYAMAEFVLRVKERLPLPEATEGRDGFVHPHDLDGNEELTTLEYIIRDFEEPTNKARIEELKRIVKEVKAKYPDTKIEAKEEFQYPNMKAYLDQMPIVSNNAVEAINRSGLTLITEPIRGGTDGSRLSALGHPCPNLGTGMANIHSKKEYVAEPDMVKSAEVVLNLGAFYAEQG